MDMKKYGPMSKHTRRLCAEILRELDFKSILDVGCGEGSFLKFLHLLRPHLEINGADISQVAIQQAGISLLNAKFFELDLENNFIQQSFDLVTAIEVIEHIKNDTQFLANMHKMTIKYLLICTLIGKMRPFEKEVGHLRNYSESQLIDKLNAAGFEILSIKKWGFPFYSPIYREILQYAPRDATTGKLGLTRKIISQLIYILFFLNLHNRGDVIFVLARPK